MSFWDFFSGRATTVAQQFRGDAITRNLANLRTALARDDFIRMYVDRGGGTGQQAAAVAMLGRIIAPAAQGGLGFNGNGKNVQIIYDDSAANTLPNLQRLLGLGNAVSGAFNGVEVRLIARSTPIDLDQVNFSFSAATDNGAPFNTICGSKWHLRLQPFGAGKPEELRVAQPAATIDLTQQPELGGADFAMRGFAIPAVTLDEAAWDAFEAAAQGSPLALRRIQVIRAILASQFSPGGSPPRKNYDVLFTYGIHTELRRNGDDTPNLSAIGGEPTDQVVQLALGVMATQVAANGSARTGALPAVIVNLDDFWYDHRYFSAAQRTAGADIFATVKALLAGGPTAYETTNLQAQSAELRRGIQQVMAARSAYLTAVGLGSVAGGVNARFLTLDDPTLDAFQRQLTALVTGSQANQRVLWVQLAPPLPPTLFNALLGQSSLPAVFEGANTANQAIAFGKMYYHVGRVTQRTGRYPDVALARPAADPLLPTLQRAANQVAALLQEWPTGSLFAPTAPPELFAAPILSARAEPPPPNPGPYGRYFTRLASVFADPDNDKYNLAFAFLGHKIQPAAPQAMLLADADLADDDGPLASLDAALTANLSGGTLKLVPGALDSTGPIGQLLGALFAAGGRVLVAQDATIGPDPRPSPLTTLEVKGDFPLGGVPLTVDATFTAPDGVLDGFIEDRRPDHALRLGAVDPDPVGDPDDRRRRRWRHPLARSSNARSAGRAKRL